MTCHCYKNSCQYLDSDVDDHIHREGGVGRCGRGNQGGGGLLQLLHRLKLTHVLLLGSHGWWEDINTKRVYYECQTRKIVPLRAGSIKISWCNKQTCVIPFHWSDWNGLQCFFQEVQQTGADDHFLRQSLEGHPGIQLCGLYSSTAFTFGCEETREFKSSVAWTIC